MAFTGKPSGSNRVDLETLARQARNGAANMTDFLERLAELQEQVAVLQTAQAATATAATEVRAGIDNLVNASDFDHSELSWNGLGLDDDLVFWRRGIDTAQMVQVGSTSPKWNKVDGWLELNSVLAADDLSYNFPSRIFRAGVTVFLQFYARLLNQENTPALQIEAGLWDKTSGIDAYLQGAVSGATGDTPEVTKIGPGAATTTYSYKVVAIGSDGSVTVSAQGSIVGAGTLNLTDYNHIEWSAVSGATEYRVYRTVGGTLGRLISITSGATSYNDQGVILQAGEAVPANAPQLAKVMFSPTALGLSSEWQLKRAEIKIPSGYNLSATGAGEQWFRLGLRGTLPAGNAVLLDRVGLSFGLGAWSPSVEDRTKPSADTVIAPVSYGGLPSYAPGYYQNGGAYSYDQNGNPVDQYGNPLY